MTTQKILNELTKILKQQDKIEWTFVVQNLGFNGNWLKVRGVIQFMLNEGIIERTNDLKTETYLKA